MMLLHHLEAAIDNCLINLINVSLVSGLKSDAENTAIYSNRNIGAVMMYAYDVGSEVS